VIPLGEEAKLHHTVPKFYLKGFADDDKRIVTVRLPGDKRCTQVITKAAATNRFYSIDGHPQGADMFEKALSEMEGNAVLSQTTVQSDGVATRVRR